MSNHSAPQIQLSKARQNLIIFALSIGAFAIGVSEFSSMGLLLEISRGLGVSESQVGVSISIYALGVVVGAPLLAIFGAGLKRKNLLLGLAFMYALANIASALAPTYGTMLVARFISGLPHGAYFGIASLVAASISPPSQKGMAVTKVMLGLAVAILVGNNAVGYRDKYQNKKLFEDFLDGKVSVGPGGKIFEELEKVEKTLKSEVSVWRNSLIGLNTFIIGIVITLFGLAYTGFNNLTQEKIKIVDKKIDNLTSLEKDIASQKETLAATEKEYKEKIRVLNEEIHSTSKEKYPNKQRAPK